MPCNMVHNTMTNVYICVGNIIIMKIHQRLYLTFSLTISHLEMGLDH